HGRCVVYEGDPISSDSAGKGSDAAQVFIPGIQLPAGGELERGHLLANVLGGLGQPNNLTPILVPTNTAMRTGPEKGAKDFIYNGPPTNSLYYKTEVDYRQPADLQGWLGKQFSSVPGNAADQLFREVQANTLDLNSAQAALALPSLTQPQYEHLER